MKNYLDYFLEQRMNSTDGDKIKETLEAITERVGRAKYEIDNAKYYDAEIQVNNVQESVNDMKQLLHLD